MQLEDLKVEYDIFQSKYGAKELDSIKINNNDYKFYFAKKDNVAKR